MKAHFIHSLDFWLLFSNGKVTKKTVEVRINPARRSYKPKAFFSTSIYGFNHKNSYKQNIPFLIY
jgi:hypothetical protein